MEIWEPLLEQVEAIDLRIAKTIIKLFIFAMRKQHPFTSTHQFGTTCGVPCCACTIQIKLDKKAPATYYRVLSHPLPRTMREHAGLTESGGAYMIHMSHMTH